MHRAKAWPTSSLSIRGRGVNVERTFKRLQMGEVAFQLDYMYIITNEWYHIITNYGIQENSTSLLINALQT